MCSNNATFIILVSDVAKHVVYLGTDSKYDYVATLEMARFFTALAAKKSNNQSS